MEVYSIVYHGLEDRNPEGWPYYLAWGYDIPVLEIRTDHMSQIIQINPSECFKIEKVLTGNFGLRIWDLEAAWEQMKNIYLKKVMGKALVE